MSKDNIPVKEGPNERENQNKEAWAELERREARRRRRKRSQFLAYTVVIVLIALLAAGIVASVKLLTARTQEMKQEEQEQQSKVEEIFATEPSISEPEPTQTVVEPTPEERLDEIVDAAIGEMSLEDRVAGLFIVTPEAITGVGTAVQAGEGTKKALESYAVGGLVYFKQNIRSEEQIKTMISNSQQYASYPLFIAVDEEGGKVARLAEAGLGTKVDTAKAIGETGDANNAYMAAQTIGKYLSDYGFNLNFAPVADLSNVDKSIMEDRSYGSDAAAASSFVNSAIWGFREQGVSVCLKHFPGIGSTEKDTHDGIAVSERTREQFEAEEFKVFQAGIDAGADMIMAGHMAAPSLTGDNTPCSLSKQVITDILREEMKFDGIVITDSLSMKAITEYYAADEAAIQALRAGCDMILMPEDFEKAYNGVLQAVKEGTISEDRINDSLRRIYRIKYADKIEE
ncbi:MAG: glycoside hydrolase family 3 protein [Lachnoclostridium sp.]|nr:glycoside hydrolase family 3 protein [Lachnospira sp.]MCM1247973.1 glycoside hydrolase family 3 protein [Lachnoclostridium sp.]MCM1535588.1 glycoside hydrolase family 3 protein [Clostridium sp.]